MMNLEQKRENAVETLRTLEESKRRLSVEIERVVGQIMLLDEMIKKQEQPEEE